MHMDYDEPGVSLVVMEAGASWPDWVGAHHAMNSVVEAQPASELPEDFAARVTHRLMTLDPRSGPLVSGLIATNGDMDPASVRMRAQIARSACSAMASARGGELLLVTDERVADEVRHGLMSLAGTLCGELAGSDVSVRVRFPEARSESGVIRRAPVVAPDVLLAESG